MSQMDESVKPGEMNLAEKREWLDSLYYVLRSGGPERVEGLLEMLRNEALIAGVDLPFSAATPPVNTIPLSKQPPFPGSREIERRIKSLVRWNAMAMVVRANRASTSIGGHISTYASAATLYEVGFNHFFHGKGDGYDGDQIFFQGHASPGIYARAFLEGRLTEKDLESFRQELRPGGGLSSYPHPWLMPEFWEYPTVSMGLGPIMSIYQARFNRYLEDRGLKEDKGRKVWAFLGDGETDEPESLGATTLAAREKLDNLIWVVNCNLQRLDGPVRGNGHIIEELEAAFRGAGWNVIKVMWGSEWDELIANDRDGLLVRRMGEVVDGEYQKYSVEGGAYIRKHFFGVDPRLLKMVENYSDEHLQKMRLGGHDPEKVYAAFKAAVEHKGHPTVVLARTIKGYGMGEAGEGKNVAHQQKKMNEQELSEFRSRFGIPVSDQDLATAPFYRPPEDSKEMEYLLERRRILGGPVPLRRPKSTPLAPPDEELFEEFARGTEDRGVSTTMVLVRMLTKIMRDKEWGKLVVPIVPDEARTFGMEALFRQSGIYSHVGQLYDPVDKDNLLYYKEAKDGQILEEGITEAGSLASFIAAGTAYANHGVNTIPFFIFYSMFGMQRVGDLVWAAGDIRARGFLIGGTAGRTTLAGEGLQHQDGNSHLLAYPVPNLITYDPAFAFELAVIIRDGMRRMYHEQEAVFYYITVENENYPMPAMPEGVEPNAILKGMYKFRPSSLPKSDAKANLFGSGTILNEALKAQHLLEDVYNVPTDVWSITSFKELYRDGMAADRWNVLHPFDPPREPYVASTLKNETGAFVIASDYVKALPASIDRWFPTPPVCLGTDGFGRSDGRRALRRFFEVNAEHITLSALTELTRQGKFGKADLKKAMRDLLVNPEKDDPSIS